MVMKISKFTLLILLITFLEILTPTKYLLGGEVLQYRNIFLVLLTLIILPVKLDYKNITLLLFFNICLALNTLIKINYGYNFSPSRFINELFALNTIFYIALCSREKSLSDFNKNTENILINFALTIFIINATLAIYFSSKGIRSHSGELMLPLLLYYSLRKHQKIARSTLTSVISFLGNSRGYGLSLAVAYIMTLRIYLLPIFIGALVLIIYHAASLDLIRNVDWNNLDAGYFKFLNIVTSGRLEEITTLLNNWVDPVFGNGIGITFHQVDGRFWSHSFIFNIVYKSGYLGLFVILATFTRYLKPENNKQVAYLVGILLYCNLDFSILLNPVWVLLYRRLKVAQL